jgi:hypothetical protein
MNTSFYYRRAQDLLDLLASIEDNGEYVPGETKKIKAELADIKKYLRRWGTK